MAPTDTALGSTADDRTLPLGHWIFSVDDHILETGCDFAARVPERFRESAPRVVDHEGGDAWLIDDVIFPITLSDGLASWPQGQRPLLRDRIAVSPNMTAWVAPAADRTTSAADSTASRLARNITRVAEDFRPGVYDIDARIRDMDEDGVWTSVLIPSNSFGFSGQRLSDVRDPEAGLAYLRAYNDWLHDDIALAHPDRFVCSGIPWLRDPVVAAEEVARNADRGFRATLFPNNPARLGYDSLHTGAWDPFFAACEETQTVLNLHVGTGFRAIKPADDSPLPVAKGGTIVDVQLSVLDWLFSGVPVRFPDLRIALTEGGIDWVPVVTGRLDTMGPESLDGFWDLSGPTPTEVLFRNFWFAALFDVSAYAYLAQQCPERVMIETDFPHSDTVWPHSQLHFAAALGDLDPDVRAAVTFGNAAALYRHPFPDPPGPGGSA